MTKRVFIFILSLSTLISFLSIAFAQQKPIMGEPITVTGKIAYGARTGGYYIQGEKPPAVLIIVNQNPEILGELAKAGKEVTVEGRLREGADLFFVEKIDGKPYMGTFVNK